VELKWDTSDSLLNPTRGMVLRGEIDHSTTALVSTTSFVKLLLEARHYYPLTERIVLATRLSVGGIEPYAGSETVPRECAFLSGGTWQQPRLCAKSSRPVGQPGRPIGGNSLLVGSVELRFPITGRFSAGSSSSTLAMSTAVASAIISAICASG
jgi:outer membrane protein assembly factor BamA